MDTPARRTSLNDIAQAAGVSRATVSLALRNQGRIAPATRQRIQQLAEQMDYRPDPGLAGLTSYLRRAKNHPKAAVLALVNNMPERAPWSTNIHLRDLFDGLRHRADMAGFKVEPFWLAEPGMTAPRLAQILHSRGIAGVIFLGFPKRTTTLDFPFAEFATVTIGHSLALPMHRVCSHQYREMQLALEHAAAAGTCRPGLVINPDVDHRVEGHYRAAYLLGQSTRPARTRLEPLLFDGKPATFQRWVRRVRPDLIMLAQPPPDPAQVARWCRKALPPADPIPRLVLLDVRDPGEGYAGIAQAYPQIAAATIDLLVTQLQHGERGLPPHPQIINIPGQWIDAAG